MRSDGNATKEQSWWDGSSVPGLGVAACCWTLVLPEHISPERVCRAGSATGGFISRARALKHFFRTQ